MAKHITELNIENFRGIRELEINNIGDFNILVGDNNCGKTSVLEAIQVFSDPSEYNIINVARQRDRYSLLSKQGLTILENFMYLFDISTSMKSENFYSFSISGKINNDKYDVRVEGEIVERLMDLKEISGYNSAVRNKMAHGLFEQQEEVKTFIGRIIHDYNHSYQISLINEHEHKNIIEVSDYTRIVKARKNEPIINSVPVWTIDHLIGKPYSSFMKNKEMLSKTVELLKLFDNNILDLRIVNTDDRFNLFIDNGLPDYIPTSMYGDGMKKVLSIANAIVSAENGVLLIDEFETAIHTSMMNQVFSFLIKACKEMNVQLFATTHSIEAVDKFLETQLEYDQETKSDFYDIDNNDLIKVITLKKNNKKGKTFARVLTGKEVYSDRENFNFEVRE